jgi:hypothetical protein
MYKNNYRSILSLILCVLLAACAAEKPAPTVTLSTERIQHKGWVGVRGEGFTPNADIRSHLKKSDGTEFPVLPMLTDEKGQFTHEIDTLLLAPGIHELWVIDSTGVSSNVAKFEVTLEPVQPR